MDSLNLSSTRNDRLAHPGAEGELHTVNEIPADSGHSSEVSLVVFGFLCAAAIAYLVQRSRPHSFAWSQLFFKSTEYIALTLAAGVLGIWFTGFIRKEKSECGLARLSRAAGAAWIFLPCIALFYGRHSPLIFPVTALATIAAALSLRHLFPAPPEAAPPHATGLPDAPLPSLYGLPPADSHPLRSLFIVLCVQGSLLCAFRGYLFLAATLLALGLYLLASRWSASNSSPSRMLSGNRPAAALCAVAFLFTVLALLPNAGGIVAFRSGSVSAKSSPRLPLPRYAETPDSGYVGIILWPPPAKKVDIVPPSPHQDSMRPGSMAKPLAIPFDGPYWYYKSPWTSPGLGARVVHRKSTDVSIRSTNWVPLRMEAHQNLGLPIDIACCGEIDVTLTNADNRPGAILVDLLLTDSASPGKPSQDLGQRVIESSAITQIPANRPPVQETLRFSIPPHAHLQHFDGLTIAFRPAAERARFASRVAVQSFQLIPR